MQVGDKVKVEFVGEITKIEKNSIVDVVWYTVDTERAKDGLCVVPKECLKEVE